MQRKALVITFLVLFVCSLLAGCRQTAGTVQAPQERKAAADLIEGKTLFYQSTGSGSPSITIKTGEEEKVVSAGKDLPSQPVVAPDRKRIAYISPFDFEELGEVHIYDVRDGSNITAIGRKDLDAQEAPKKVAWFDDGHLFVIIGFAYGTVSIGGDLYIYDTTSKKLALFMAEPEKNRMIKDVKVDGEQVILDEAVYDENYNNYTVEQKVLQRQEVADFIAANFEN